MGKNISSDSNAIYDLLTDTQVIALVGHSHDPQKDSYRVAQYLREAGYTVYPVNPTVAQIDGETSYKKVSDIPARVDLVDVFRGSRHVPGIVEDAITAGAKAIWTQLGIEHSDAARKAMDAGLDVVMNRCTKIEHARMRVPKKG